jgi:demethylmenaquinone methyltransferase / 2-methoxy-6-polyprenyl-1,4-benzoquinol methylase
MKEPQSDKKTEIGSMFNDIAFRYDFLNHFLSFGIDRMWRRKAIKLISGVHNKPEVLDVATGTGDLAIAAMKLDPEHITGIDISRKMLEIGKEKIMRRDLSDKIDLKEGDSENIPFGNNSFDVAMVSFGVRNFADPLKGLSEMQRVIKPGGLIMVLEFSKPSTFLFRQLYFFYFRHLLPLIGKRVSGNRKAYRYLHDSVMLFPDNEQFTGLMIKAGLAGVRQKKLSGGIASIYTGLKPSIQ